MGTEGVITEEGIARLRARIGVAEPHPMPPHYALPTTDTFRHVAEAYGDDNPLWCDPSYAERTRWDGPIAPPVLVGGDTLIGDDEVTELDPDTKALLKGEQPHPEPFRQRVINSRDGLQHLDPLQTAFPLTDLDYCAHVDAFDFAMLVTKENGRHVMRAVNA